MTRTPSLIELPNNALEYANLGYDLEDPCDEIRRWAQERLQIDSIDPQPLDRLVGLHAAVCAVLAGCVDGEMNRHLDAVEMLNRASLAAPVAVVLRVGQDGDVTADIIGRGRDLEGALGELAQGTIQVVSAFADRLRRCEARACRRYFLRDRAHRNWCSLGCGNRTRVARHHARQVSNSRPAAMTTTEGRRS